MAEDTRLPYGKWRGGRPRFHPSRGRLCSAFKARTCATRMAAGSLSRRPGYGCSPSSAEIVQARATGRKRRPLARPTSAGGTVADLLDDWLEALERRLDDPVDPISPDTVESYRKAANAIRFKPETRDQAKARRAKERAAELLGLEPPARAVELFSQAPGRLSKSARSSSTSSSTTCCGRAGITWRKRRSPPSRPPTPGAGSTDAGGSAATRGTSSICRGRKAAS